ncbi:TPA: BlaI/MecI/CopY family transcriptional regulator, partial [Legionella pneumophila]
LLLARKLQHDDIQAIEEALKQLNAGEKQTEVM